MSHVNLKNITPGEILLEDYMKPMGLSQNALARALGVTPRRVNEIVHGKRNQSGHLASSCPLFRTVAAVLAQHSE
jgi:addiction module HigA family antidote